MHNKQYAAQLHENGLEAERKHKEHLKSLWAVETKRFLSSKQWKLAKLEFFKHFKKICANCGSTDNIHLDHIYPRVKDNKGERWLDITNLQPLCRDCNCSVKGTKSTDYREYPTQRKALETKPLFEAEFVKRGYNTKWLMWEGKTKKPKKEIDVEQGRSRKEWKGKIKKCVKLGMSYFEIIENFKISMVTEDYKYIVNYIEYALSDQFKTAKEKKKENQKRRKVNKKRKDNAWKLMDALYEKRNELNKEQLIKAIELIAKGTY